MDLSRAARIEEQFGPNGVLDGQDVVPAFLCPLSELFGARLGLTMTTYSRVAVGTWCGSTYSRGVCLPICDSTDGNQLEPAGAHKGEDLALVRRPPPPPEQCPRGREETGEVHRDLSRRVPGDPGHVPRGERADLVQDAAD